MTVASEIVIFEESLIQLPKLSALNCIDPEQLVSVVLMVTVLLSITSLNVIDTPVETETNVSLSEGEVEVTMGAVVSIPPFVPAIVYLSKVSSFLAHEYTISRISPEIRLVFIIDSSEKETDTK